MDKTKKSRLLNDIALKTFPGGINHNIRHYDPYPFQTKRANKQYIWDVDDNKYTDYWMGHMALILGHSPENIPENPMTSEFFGIRDMTSSNFNPWQLKPGYCFSGQVLFSPSAIASTIVVS